MTPRRIVPTAAVLALVAAAAAAYVFRADLVRLGGAIGIRGATAPTAEKYVCPMHPDVISDRPGQTCPQCGMDLVKESELAASAESSSPADHAERTAADAGTPRAAVSLDARRQQLIGVRLATATRTTIAHQVRAVGTVQFDETRLADVNVRVEGYVRELLVDATGQYVSRGQPLFRLYSPELHATAQEYVLALRTRDELHPSVSGEARKYADRLVDAARQRLALWDLPADEIAAIEHSRTPRDSVTFKSPASGHVIEKKVVLGQRVMPGESLYRLADLGTVWVEADVFQRDVALVKVGSPATVTVDAWRDEHFPARVVLIAPSLDAVSRTARVRFTLRNPSARLRPGMFANVELAATSTKALAVPADAVVDSGTRQFVFVSQGDGYFEPREVEAGARGAGLVEIRKGLDEGQQVASGATFFIDSESQLRAAMEAFTPAPDLTAASGSQDGHSMSIDFRTDPDPPVHGDNMLVVRLHDADGKAVTDAEVSVRLYMAPMPSMNMPAMRADATLLGGDDGEYHGHANVSMAGRWDVTVTVSRKGTRLGTKSLGITAR
jgi:Cu(I)/Ag(I) efflux system membrane fusion protein/cobalt-zinc-cadmium efflux system membrane fusion protein